MRSFLIKSNANLTMSSNFHYHNQKSSSHYLLLLNYVSGRCAVNSRLLIYLRMIAIY